MNAPYVPYGAYVALHALKVMIISPTATRVGLFNLMADTACVQVVYSGDMILQNRSGPLSKGKPEWTTGTLISWGPSEAMCRTCVRHKRREELICWLSSPIGQDLLRS